MTRLAAKRALGLGLVVAALAAMAGTDPVFSQNRAPAGRCDPARTLGVSRTLDVDTSGGPRFGHQQYKEINFLQDGEIVLTFDDGPLRVHTQAVVDALERECTKATFFMVGAQAIADPDMVRQIHRKGHTVATHTWSHQDLRKLAPLAARQELELGFSAVAAAAGQPIAPFFRFPFLSDPKAMKDYAQSRQIGVFSIEVDAYDYKHKDNPQAVQDAVMNQLANFKKGILLFHDIQPSTAAALPGVLRALQAKGYRVVHLRPTTPAATLPEFDAMVAREQARKRIASAANPLAGRALTAPLPSRETLPRPQPAASPLPPPPSAVQGTGPYGLPPGTPPRPRRPAEPADDWRRRILGQ